MKIHPQPFAWIKKIDESLKELDCIPLRGNAQCFNLKQISKALGERFGIEDFSITLEEGQWRKADQLTKGLGLSPLTFAIRLSPLAEEILWMMSRKEIQRLTSLILLKEKDQEITSEPLQEGFYRYLTLHVLDALQGMDPLKDFSLQINPEPSPKEEDAYSTDVHLSLTQDIACRGRLILDKEFILSWQRHFSSLNRPFCPSPLAKSIEVQASVQTGSVLLDRSIWEEIEVGDVLLLDRGSFDPKHKEGVATLSLGATPLFHISIKENKIKLLDYALFYEEDMQNEQDTEAKELLAPDEGRMAALKDLPLNITVELARLRMNVDQLMQLTPGNFLQLPIHPDQGVTLSVNGQKIGRGEMVYLGEALGIRILELADQ